MLGFEIKRSAAPRPSKGLLAAMRDLSLEKAYIVSPVRESFPMARQLQVVPPDQLPRVLGRASATS